MDEEERQQCLIIAKVSDSQNERNHIPGRESELEFHKDNRMYFGYAYPKIYLNGDSSINEGYVSIHIRSNLPFRASYEDFTITIIVSVIDIDRSERFSRSFTFDCCDFAAPWISFPISRYITLETLLNESSVLLPSNCFTVHIKVILGNLNPATEKYHQIIGHMLEGLYADWDLYKLDLSSHVGKRLCEESSVLRDMLDLTSEREMLIEWPAEEYAALQYLYILIMDCDYVRFGSIESLYEVYKLADKYDVQLAVETCQLLFKCLFSSENQKFLSLVFHELHMLEYAVREEIKNNFLLKTDTNFQDTSPLVWTCELNDFNSCKTFIFSKEVSEKFDFYS